MEYPQEYNPEQSSGSQQPYSEQRTPPPPSPVQGPSYGRPTQPMAPAQQRNWAVATHLSPIIAFFVGGLSFLGPLVLYLVLRDRGDFIRRHSAGTLNFQLSMWIGLLISVPLMFVIIGFVTAGAILVAMVVCHILGAVAANEGRDYRYPFTIRFVS